MGNLTYITPSFDVIVVPPFFDFQQKFNLRSAQKINAPKKPKKKDENAVFSTRYQINNK
jgi:hypothetical protein